MHDSIASQLEILANSYLSDWIWHSPQQHLLFQAIDRLHHPYDLIQHLQHALANRLGSLRIFVTDPH